MAFGDGTRQLLADFVAEVVVERSEVRGLDDHDWEEACRRNATRRTDATASDADLLAIEAECRQYLQLHPEGKYRATADSRLKELSALRDDRVFRKATEASRRIPPDLDAEQKAWQEYLDAFPAGGHAAEARDNLAKIPDRADELSFKQYEVQVQDLIRSAQYPQALDQIDRALLEVKAPDRQAALRTMASGVTAKLEELDLQKCMVPIQLVFYMVRCHNEFSPASWK